jgi:hypothetical protein
MRPKDLVAQVRALVLTDRSDSLDLDHEAGDGLEGIEKALSNLESTARELGKAVAQNPDALRTLARELVCSGGSLWPFGLGLAEATPEPKAIWDMLVDAFENTPERDRRLLLLGALLSGIRERDHLLADSLLEAALQDKTLGPYFPVLQGNVGLADGGLERVKRSIELGIAPISVYANLAVVRIPDPLAAPDLRDLVLAIAAKPDGFDPAMEVLHMRLFSDRNDKREHSPEILEAGRELLRRLQFVPKQGMSDYRLGNVAQACLRGAEGGAVAQDMIDNLRRAVRERKTQAGNHDELLSGIFEAQPSVALEAMFSGNPADRDHGINLIGRLSRHEKNPLDAVPVTELYAWCDVDPTVRYLMAGAAITPFRRPEETQPLAWTPVALGMVERAPEPIEVLKLFIGRFVPMAWSGSRAAATQTNADLLLEFEHHPDLKVAAFARSEKQRLSSLIKKMRDDETAEDRSRDERFE